MVGCVVKGGMMWFVFIGYGVLVKDGKDGVFVGYDA